MENQESRKFFSLLLENLQALCRSHLTYSSSVEVSGYVCLELDNYKKERYFLSELINRTGTAASASCCTQILHKSNVRSDDLTSNRVEISSSRSSFKALNEGSNSSEVQVVSVQMEEDLVNKNLNMSAKLVQNDEDVACDGSNDQVMVNTPRTCIIMENAEESVEAGTAHGDKTFSEAERARLCTETVTYLPHKEPESHVRERAVLERPNEGTVMSEQNFGHVKEEMVESNLIEIVPSSYQTDQVKQLKERIQAISNAKMAVPWLGTPLIQSIRNSVERVEMQQKQTKSQSATQTKSDLVVDYSGEMFPPHAMYGQPMFPTTHGNMAVSFQGMNSLNFLPNGVRVTSDCLTEQVDELVNQAVDSSPQMPSFGTGYAYNVLNSPAKRPKSKREGPTYRVKQNWKYAVRQFENFLVHKGMEVVPICTFPPTQLDGLLCEFILWVKKNNGEDFHPWSVKNFFYHLECHLKEYGYGSSITKGPEFKRSRDVLKQKVNDLEAKLHEQSQVLKHFQGK